MTGRAHLTVHVTAPAFRLWDDGTVVIVLDPDGRGEIVVDDTDTSLALAQAAMDAHEALAARQREDLVAEVARPRYEPEANLPGWAEMSDLDKGAALLHLHKRDWEGGEYAEENYPAEYFDDPRLTALATLAACRHAVSVEDDADRAGALRGPEYERLYELALAADRARGSAAQAAEDVPRPGSGHPDPTPPGAGPGHTDPPGVDLAGERPLRPGEPGDGGEPAVAVRAAAALPAEAPQGDETCDALHEHWICTAVPGHDGGHVAHGVGGEVVHSWPQEATP